MEIGDATIFDTAILSVTSLVWLILMDIRKRQENVKPQLEAKIKELETQNSRLQITIQELSNKRR